MRALVMFLRGLCVCVGCLSMCVCALVMFLRALCVCVCVSYVSTCVV